MCRRQIDVSCDWLVAPVLPLTLTLISLEELVDRFLKVVFSVKSKRSGRVGGVW